MSERTPGPGSDPRRAPDDWLERDWLEHEGSSVFGAPRQRVPTPRSAPPPHSPPPGGPQAWNPAPWPSHSAGRAPAPAEPAPMPPTRTWDLAPWAAPPGGTSRPGPVPLDDGQAPGRRPPPGRPGDGRDRARSRPSGRPTGPAGRGVDRDQRIGGSGSGLRSPVGLGAVVGLGGLVAFLAALVVLPWFTVAGEGVTLADMREAFTVTETDPADVVPGAGDTASTIPTDALPTPDAVTDAAEQQARDAAGDAAAAALDSARSRYVELYADVLWLGVAGVVAAAAVASTVFAPRSAALSLLLGVRRAAGALVVLAGLAHVAALWVVFSGDGAPSPATGVWLGLGGLVAVLAGCAVGPRNA